MNAGDLAPIGARAGEKLLIYGIGNPGRQDDGLGVRLVEKLEAAGLGTEPVRLEAGYQLNIEDAWLISDFDIVLFADASVEAGAPEPFSLRPLGAAREVAFTTHAMRAESVLSLCEELYGVQPRAYMMALPGYEWGISEELSPRARSNLEQAFECLAAEVRCMRSR